MATVLEETMDEIFKSVTDFETHPLTYELKDEV
jgi:hypothetical protein